MGKSHAEQEIVANIQAFGEELQGDAEALANILEALAGCLGKYQASDCEPDYAPYEDTQHGRAMAEAYASGATAWKGMADTLVSLAGDLRKTMEFYI